MKSKVSLLAVVCIGLLAAAMSGCAAKRPNLLSRSMTPPAIDSVAVSEDDGAGVGYVGAPVFRTADRSCGIGGSS